MLLIETHILLPFSLLIVFHLQFVLFLFPLSVGFHLLGGEMKRILE